MGVTYDYDGRLIVISMAGEYPASDVLRVTQEALADPGCPDHPRLLMDVRQSSSFVAAPRERIVAVAKTFHEVAPSVGGRCAVLTSSALQFGLARMGAAFAERDDVQIGVFRSREDAVAWLGREGQAQGAG